MMMLIPVVEVDCHVQSASYIMSIKIEDGKVKMKALIGEYSINEGEFKFIAINKMNYYDDSNGESIVPYNIKPIMMMGGYNIYAAETIAIIPVEGDRKDLSELYNIAYETYIREYGLKVKPNSAFIHLLPHGFAIVRLTRKMNIYEAVERIITFTNTYILDVIGEADYVLLN
jgi:hypothetical protein